MRTLEAYAPRGFECVCGNSRMAARTLTALYDEALAPAGIRAAQLAVLWAIVALPDSTVNRLAGTIAMDPTTLTRNLRGLKQAGLVSLRTGEDRRHRVVRASAKGRRVFERAMPLWQMAQRKVERLTGRGLRELNRVLLALSRPARA